MLKTDVLILQQNAASTIRGTKAKRNLDRDISKGVEIIEVLTKNKCDFEDIAKLSKIDEKNIIDPSLIYNRLARLNKSDWDRVLQLGEQTGILSFNDISVLKTVIQKIKRKESIDLKRLQIAVKAIDKLKKFGIKY